MIAICAETDEGAERIASSGRMMFSLLRMGQLIPIPPPEKALAYLETASAPTAAPVAAARSWARRRPSERGSRRPSQEYGTDELMILTITYDHEARRRSYELIAEAKPSRGSDTLEG